MAFRSSTECTNVCTYHARKIWKYAACGKRFSVASETIVASRHAHAMIRYFASARDGHACEVPAAIALAVGNEEIVVTPDDVLVSPKGGRIVRRVRTGHYRSSDETDAEAAAFVLAVAGAFPGAAVELAHLADEAARPLALGPKQVEARRSKITALLADIRAGRFPAQPSERTCPGCPAFFVCGPVPQGPVTKKF